MLAWYKDASERGAERWSWLSQGLPGRVAGLGQDASRPQQDTLVPKAALGPPTGGGSSCSAACLVTNQREKGREQLTGENTRGSGSSVPSHR